MRVFLTGGTGYIGGAVVRRLAERGDSVCCLVRPTSDRSVLDDVGVDCVEGDLESVAGLSRGMSGADWVVHAAAELNFASSEERMREVNVVGSQTVARCAVEVGVPALLNVSSMAVFGGSPRDGSPGSEETPRLEPLPSKYARTKLGGERSIDAEASRASRPPRVVHVHPSLVYGPPGKKHGSNAMLRQMVQGRLPAVIGADRWLTWVHVDDVAEAVVRLLDRESSRSHYLLAGDPIRVGDLVRRVSELAEVASPRIRLSPRTAKWLVRVLGRLGRRRMPVARENLENLARHWRFDDAAAREDLDWHPRTLDDSLVEVVDWLRRAG